MLLVELHFEELLEKRSQPERLDAKQLRSDARVEDVVDVPAVILMKQTQVVVGVMEYDLHVRILKYVTQTLRHPDRKRVDDRAPFARRYLEQIDSIDEPMEARSLSIDRYLTDPRDVGEEVLRLLLGI